MYRSIDAQQCYGRVQLHRIFFKSYIFHSTADITQLVLFYIAISLILFLGVPGYAQSPPMQPSPPPHEVTEPKVDLEKQGTTGIGKQEIVGDPYAGLVVNQTMTVAGQDFFQYFSAAWRDKETTDKYEISVNERPSARLGSQIWINYGQKRIFQANLPASRAAIKPVGLMAADAVYEAIVQSDVQRLLFRDHDLAPDEF